MYTRVKKRMLELLNDPAYPKSLLPRYSQSPESYVIHYYLPKALQHPWALSQWAAQSIASLPQRTQEFSVKEKLFLFWQQELQRTQQGQATHPLSRWLFKQPTEVFDVLQEMLAYHFSNHPTDIQFPEQFYQACFLHLAWPAKLYCAMLELPIDEPLKQILYSTSSHQYLFGLREYIQRDIMLLPHAYLQTHALDLAALYRGESPKNLGACCQALCMKPTKMALSKTHRPMMLQSRFGQQLAIHYQKQQWPIMKCRLQLPPWQYAYQAWKLIREEKSIKGSCECFVENAL